MKGSEAKLVSYMQGSDKRFVIPVYQRNYDWKQENCKQLYDDLVRIVRDDRKSHFFGSIVSVHNEGQFNEFLIIDGQQRLTTVSLLMLAIHDAIEAGVVTPTDSRLADKIYRTYLIDEWQDDETRIKLKPVKNDSKAFQMLFQSPDDYIKGSNLTANYRYFYTRVQKEEVSVDALYTAITRLEIINITLNHEDNPQLIFESLNSTGLALSEGDKIRNFILMGLPIKEQNTYYDAYWNRIELNTGYNVSAFVRDYLSLKQQVIPTMDRVYLTFKRYVEDQSILTEPLLCDLLAYSKRYRTLLRGDTSDKALDACIDRLNRLETAVTRPFFLEVLRLKDENKITLHDVRDIFRYTETYLFRRMVCDVPTNALNKIFLMLHREIIRFDGTDNNYLDKFKYALLTKTESGRFPTDDEFVANLSTKPVYQMRSKNKVYLFERLENHGTLEDKDIYRHCDDGTYSIEHIMPQHLTPVWVSDLGEDYVRIHETWLHRLANLTLTAYNSRYSNAPFAEKRDMEHGFRDSGLRMNLWIAEQRQWTEAELEKRNDLLMERALKIWSAPVTTYQPIQKELESVTLDEDVDLSGRDISRFEYLHTEQPVTSWVDMQERMIKILHAENPAVLSMIANSNDAGNELFAYVKHAPSELRVALKIDEDLYVERNTSTNTKMAILRKIFRAYGIDPSLLTFYLRDTNDTQLNPDEEGTRFEVRRKYWTFALDYIKQAFGADGPFSKTNPGKENWLNGFIGIGGFTICCIANHDKVEVQIYLGKSDKEKNKAAYDYLFTRRAEIESALHTPLTWQRLDDKKCSIVCNTLTGVSITRETDWTMMAKFHAEWARKFNDVIVPMLKAWADQ